MNSTPNIFVIGLSKVGKTPLADQLASPFGFTRVSASEWIRSTFVPVNPENALAEITVASQERLQADPDVCVRFITKKYNVVERGGFVIEGLRNPRDFALLFRPERDFVLFVTHPNNTLAPTAFETAGVGVIRSTVDWMAQNRLLDRSRVAECVVAGLREEGSLSDLFDHCSTPCYHSRVMFKSLDPAIRFAVDWLGHYIPRGNPTMTPQAKKNLEREIRRMRHQALTDFNTEHRRVPCEERAALKARLNEGLDRLERFMRSQPEPKPEPPNPYKPPKTRRKSRMIYDNK